jgi:hypothetical protein
MTIAFVTGVHAAAQAASGSAKATTGAIDTTGCNFLVIATTSATNPTDVSDSKSNTWTGLTAGTGNSYGYVRLYYCVNPTVGSGHTFSANASLSAQYAALSVSGFSGVTTSGPFDKESTYGWAGSVATLGASSITPTNDGELLITAAQMISVVSAESIGGGFTKTDFLNIVSGQAYGTGMGYLIQGTEAASTATWSWTTNSEAQVVQAAFIAAAVDNLMAQACL